jgi:hypothetical protein
MLAVSGTAIGVPKKPGETPFSFANNKTQTISQIINHTLNDQPWHPSGETLLRSRDTPPYRQDSASLEGRTPPRVRFLLARGSHELAAPHLLPRPEHLMF